MKINYFFPPIAVIVVAWTAGKKFLPLSSLNGIFIFGYGDNVPGRTAIMIIYRNLLVHVFMLESNLAHNCFRIYRSTTRRVPLWIFSWARIWPFQERAMNSPKILFQTQGIFLPLFSEETGANKNWATIRIRFLGADRPTPSSRRCQWRAIIIAGWHFRWSFLDHRGLTIINFWR